MRGSDAQVAGRLGCTQFQSGVARLGLKRQGFHTPIGFIGIKSTTISKILTGILY